MLPKSVLSVFPSMQLIRTFGKSCVNDMKRLDIHLSVLT